MNDWLASFGPIASVAASALVSALWEGAVLAGLTWAALRAFPRLSAAARSMVWLGVFALLIGLQVLPLVLPGNQGGVAVPDASVSYGLHLDARWGYVILVLWVVLSLVRTVQLGIGVAHLWRLARRAVELPADAGFEEIVAGRRVRLCVSDEIARPSVIGFFRPRVLIPAKLMASLPEAELKQVLIHEMEHLRRADDWTNLLQKLALVAFPLNPALAWVERRLCAERELACDDRVLEAGNGRKAYAMCLAHLAEHAMLQRGMSLALGAWEKRPELVRRVERILRGGERTLGRRLAIGVTGGVMAASLMGALALSRSPEMVSFAPVAQAEIASSEAPKLVGAKPQLVKMTMPAEVHAMGTVCRSHLSGKSKNAVRVGHPITTKQPELKLAGLRKPMEKAPRGNGLLVMTEWNDLGVQQRVIWAMLREGREPAAVAVPAVYFVATPNGWLIVQI
jgi:beta-lactamase regulating signal transducer with metallopeptidase domain